MYTNTYKTTNTTIHQGTWGAITTRHFHPNTHECYGLYLPFFIPHNR